MISLLQKTLMRRFIAIIFILFAITSCSDNGCKPVKPDVEDSQMQSFATTNSFSVTKHSSGMYYEIVNPGSGPTPNLNSKVYVTYQGKFLDGTIFDQASTPISGYLSNFIEGWQVGLPLIQKGGQIRLVIPSSMAYGCTGNPPVISPNTIVYFDIHLIDVQ